MPKITLLALLFSCSVYAQASENDLISLINHRLAFMKDVAGNKAVHHQAIEDLTQEQNVLDATLAQAQQKGIDPTSIKPFIVAQMDAAKAIQYRYRADWLSVPENNWQPKDLKIVRAEISQLSSEIIDRIASELYQHRNLSDISSEKFMNIINQKNLSKADKLKLLNTLKMIHLR